MEMLGEVELKVASRILKNDFICESFRIANCNRPTYPSVVTAARSNTDHFWRKHCGAVPLVKTQESVVVNNSGKPISTFPARFMPVSDDLSQRKVATCSRCHSIMYPGPSGSPENHKKGYCSDGVKPTMKGDTTPDWPQPQGIFELGTKFNPANFLAALRNVYDQVTQGYSGDTLPMEFQALIKLLHSRLTVAEDVVLPKFSLKLSELSSNPNQTQSLGLGLGNSPVKLNSGVQFGQKP